MGPLLPSPPKPPGQMFLDHWLNPIAIFAAHWYFSIVLKPYIGTIRPVAITAAWFIIPVAVYLYQNVVLKAAAKRLFLEPLNDRGQLDTQSTSWKKYLQRRIDAVIVAPWSVILVGPALDGVFWLVLKGSEGTHSTIKSKQQLMVLTIVIFYWYLRIASSDGRLVTWCSFIIFAVIFANSLHGLIKAGLTAFGLLPYCALFFNMWMFKVVVGRMWRSRR